MEPINLEPRYSAQGIPGKCLKCLAEQEMNSCLLELLRMEGEDAQLEHRYEALVAFLQSPEAARLRDEAEKYLADGKRVTLQIGSENGQPRYELKLE